MKLRRLNWNPRNYDALNALLGGVKPGEIAVFDWDNTCAFNDIGEALLRRLTFGLEFRMDAAAMAAALPEAVNGIGRILLRDRPLSLRRMKEAICSAYGRLKGESGKGGRDEDYRVFTSGLLALNRGLEETPGIGCEFAYPWVNTLLRGLTPAELDGMAAAVAAAALREPLRRHVASDPRGRWRYGWQGGIRVYPEMRDLAACWQERGGAVVISTASNRQLVERTAAMTGFPCRQVIGMELELRNRRFAPVLKPGLQPNLGAGKVANIRSRLGREPALVAGDSRNDLEMFIAFAATRARLVIERHARSGIARLVGGLRPAAGVCLAQRIDPRQGAFRSGDRRC